MLRYKCYICGKNTEERICNCPNTIYVPDPDGREVEYDVCEECEQKFKNQLKKAKRKIFEEMTKLL